MTAGVSGETPSRPQGSMNKDADGMMKHMDSHMGAPHE
jgi:hypothetical protein